QPSEPMAHRRRRQLEPLACEPYVPRTEHDIEQHEQVQVDPRKINFVQHVAEIISLDSAREPYEAAQRFFHTSKDHGNEEYASSRHGGSGSGGLVDGVGS